MKNVDRAFRRKKELSNIPKTNTTERTVDILNRDNSEVISDSMKVDTSITEHQRLLEYLHLKHGENTYENGYGTIQKLCEHGSRE